jgi:hypothetical protein
VVVAGWFAILAVPLILLRISSLLLTGDTFRSMVSTTADPTAWVSNQGLETLVMLLVGPIALISLVSGIAILRMKRWAWVVLMLFLVLALILNLARSYLHTPEYGLMLIYSVLALVLNQPDVRKAFRIGRPADEPVE